MVKQLKSVYKPLVPAVDQAGKILLRLGDNKGIGMSVTELCKDLGIHKSKGYSILNTLMQYNFILKNPRTKTYSLGPGLLSLAKNVQYNLDIRQLSEPYLIDLANETKSTVLLGIISNDQFYISETYEVDDTFGITIRKNQSFHITHGAHGKAIAAFMDKSEQKHLLKQKELHFYGKGKEIDIKFLKKELSDCRENGYAIDHGSITPGINALSSPIFDADNLIIAGIVLVGTFPQNTFEEYGKNVSSISKKISRKCGAKFNIKG